MWPPVRPACCRPAGVARDLRPGPMGSYAPEDAGWFSSNVCRMRSATVIASSPSCAAARSTRTGAAPASRRRTGRPRTMARPLGGVSSFGFSGTNAHIVLGPAPVEEPKNEATGDRPLHLLALSARTPQALRKIAGLYADVLPHLNLADMAWSANNG